MATRTLLAIFVVLLLLQPFQSSHQFEDGEVECWYMVLDRDQVGRVTDALWDAGYTIMSLILARKLPEMRVCYGYRQRPTIPLTLFVPKDDAVRFGPNMSLYYQIMPSRLQRDDFTSGKLPSGSEITTCFRHRSVNVTSWLDEGSGSRASINNVEVTDWDIYNDGNITLHGVEDFFNIGWSNWEVYKDWDISVDTKENRKFNKDGMNVDENYDFACS